MEEPDYTKLKERINIIKTKINYIENQIENNELTMKEYNDIECLLYNLVDEIYEDEYQTSPPDSAKAVECEFCNYEFHDYQEYRNHLITLHEMHSKDNVSITYISSDEDTISNNSPNFHEYNI